MIFPQAAVRWEMKCFLPQGDYTLRFGGEGRGLFLGEKWCGSRREVGGVLKRRRYTETLRDRLSECFRTYITSQESQWFQT